MLNAHVYLVWCGDVALQRALIQYKYSVIASRGKKVWQMIIANSIFHHRLVIARLDFCFSSYTHSHTYTYTYVIVIHIYFTYKNEIMKSVFTPIPFFL